MPSLYCNRKWQNSSSESDSDSEYECEVKSLPLCSNLKYPKTPKFNTTTKSPKEEPLPSQDLKQPIFNALAKPTFENELQRNIKENDKYEEDVEQWFSKPPPTIPGCMDPTAINYNPAATVSDGSCTYNIPGCMDPTAINYNPAATVSDGSCTYTPTPPDTPQYTSDHGLYPTTTKDMMNTSTIISQNVPTVTRQDPDGIEWISPTTWTNAQWDGNPVDPTTLTKSQLCAYVAPTSNTIRGLRERFYEVNPYADNTNPTVAEIDAWNLEVIRHIRNLLGITTPVNHNPKLYLEARWADERKFTQVWDSTYSTGVPGTSDGPCWDPAGSTNPVDTATGHCGASFFPNATDRAAYIAGNPYQGNFITYPELASYPARYSQTEGLASVNANIPWSIKLGRIIANWFCTEGLTGHSGPFVNRQEFGCSWWLVPGYTTTSGQLGFRGKWR
jgi:hypothetical protein